MKKISNMKMTLNMKDDKHKWEDNLKYSCPNSSPEERQLMIAISSREWIVWEKFEVAGGPVAGDD